MAPAPEDEDDVRWTPEALYEALQRRLAREVTEPVLVAKNLVLGANVLTFVLEEHGVLDLRQYCASVADGIRLLTLRGFTDFFLGVMASMFSHVDAKHLLNNMVTLHFSTMALPADLTVWEFLVTYFGAGFAGFQANVFLAQVHRAEWMRRLSAAEGEYVCDAWYCKSSGYNDFARFYGRTMEYSRNGDKLGAMVLNEAASRVGASAAVYGVVGAALVLRYSRIGLSDLRGWDAANFLGVLYHITPLIKEILSVPLSLETLQYFDRVDHTAHAGGLALGVVVALGVRWRIGWK